jgi:hypothetical protein
MMPGTRIAGPSKAELRMQIESLKTTYPAVKADISESSGVLAVRTHPVGLETPDGSFSVNLGRFEIRIPLEIIGTGQIGAIEVEALEPVHPGDDSISHPYVQGMSMCYGTAKTELCRTLKQGLLVEVFQTIHTILTTYDPQHYRPYAVLSAWRGESCAGCGSEHEDLNTCPRCSGGQQYCDDCSTLCDYCVESICSDHIGQCRGCDMMICFDHFRSCSRCGEEGCPTCTEYRPAQRRILCGLCVEQLNEEETDHESETTREENHGANGDEEPVGELRRVSDSEGEYWTERLPEPDRVPVEPVLRAEPVSTLPEPDQPSRTVVPDEVPGGLVGAEHAAETAERFAEAGIPVGFIDDNAGGLAGFYRTGGEEYRQTGGSAAQGTEAVVQSGGMEEAGVVSGSGRDGGERIRDSNQPG